MDLLPCGLVEFLATKPVAYGPYRRLTAGRRTCELEGARATKVQLAVFAGLLLVYLHCRRPSRSGASVEFEALMPFAITCRVALDNSWEQEW